MKSRPIAIDFDGTCVTHEFPEIGKDIGAVPVLKELVEKGHKLILWTMRSGETLEAAKKWFADRDIPLWGVNQNPDQSWSKSPKAYAAAYIDDAALGCPLIYSLNGKRPYVDWHLIRKYLKREGFI